jgi:type I restriction enzyme S subunit
MSKPAIQINKQVDRRGSLVEAINLPSHWKSMHMEEIAKQFISGGTPSTKKQGYWDGDVPWTTSAPISETDTVLNSAQRYITQDGLENSASHLVPKHSLLVGTRVGVGKAVTNIVDIAISQDLTGVILDSSTIDVSFAAYQFKTGRVQDFFNGRKRGTTIQGISRFDLQALNLHIPPLHEQRAITWALRAVRDAIEARRREVELEQERKAALMQHLFTYGTHDESCPTRKTRLGNVPQEWREKLLKECAYVQTGVAKGRKLRGGNIVTLPYLRVANVQDGYLDLSEIKSISLAKHETDRYKLHPGDIVLTEGGDFDKLGRGFVWKGEIPDCVHQNHIFAVRVDQDILLPEYLAYLVQSYYGKSYFLSVAHKTTNLACINSSKLKSFPTLIPSFHEQEQIVSTLNTCDTKISTLERETTCLDELFRAMLEELMTGRLSAVPLIDSKEPV